MRLINRLRRKILTNMAVSLGLAAMAIPAFADDFPSKPVSLIVPYGAGGSTDTMARVFAKAFGNALGQPVVVVNRKGGGGSVGASFLKNTEADGHTVLLGGIDEITAWAPQAYEVDFALEDFRFIGAVANYQSAFVAPTDQPFATLEEFVTYAKANSGVPVVGQGGMSGLFLDYLAEKEGLEIRRVTASSGAEAMQLLLAGNAVMSFSGGVHAKYTEQVKVLGALGETRLAASPDVMTFKESGYELAMPSMVGMMVPAGVSDEVVTKLEEALVTAAEDSDFVTIVEERLKSKVNVVSSADTTAMIRDMAVKLAPLAIASKN